MINYKKESTEIFEYHKFVEFKNLPKDYIKKAYSKIGITEEMIKRRLNLDSLEGLTLPVYEEERCDFKNMLSNLTLPTVDLLKWKIMSLSEYYQDLHYSEDDIRMVNDYLNNLEN